MVAMVSIGAMRLAIEDWRQAGGERSVADYLTGYLKQTALASPERKATPGAWAKTSFHSRFHFSHRRHRAQFDRHGLFNSLKILVKILVDECPVISVVFRNRFNF